MPDKDLGSGQTLSDLPIALHTVSFSESLLTFSFFFCNGKCLKHQILQIFYILSVHWSFWCCSCKGLGEEGEYVFLFPLKQILLIKCEGCFQPGVPSFWSPVSCPLHPCLFSLAFFWIPATLTCPSWAGSPFPKVLWIQRADVHLFCSCCQTVSVFFMYSHVF